MAEPGEAGLEAGQQLDLVLEQILQNARPEVADALPLCAVPNWFDGPMLSALRGESTDSDRILAAVQRFTFVERLEGGRFTLHDNIRTNLQARLQPADRRELHQRAAEEYGRRLAELRAEEQRPLQLDRIYHQLRFDAPGALRAVQDLFQAGARAYALDICEALVALLQGASQADYGDWATYYQSRVELLYRRTEAAAALLAPLIERIDTLDGDLAAGVRHTFAQTESLQGHWQEAIEHYQQSFAHFQKTGHADMAAEMALEIAETYTSFSEFTHAFTFSVYTQRTFRPAILFVKFLFLPIAAWLAWSLSGNPFGIGPRYFAFHSAEVIVRAVRWYRTALDLAKDPQQKSAIRFSLTRFLLYSGDYRGALDTLNDLIDSPVANENKYQLAHLYSRLANVEVLHARWPEAEERASTALDIFRQYGDRLSAAGTYTIRGMVRLLMEKRGPGLADFTESIAIFRDADQKIALGRVFQQINDLDESLLQELDIDERDRIFIATGQTRNQNLLSAVWLASVYLSAMLVALVIAPILPFWIYLGVLLLASFWLGTILILPAAKILVPLDTLRQLQSTLILMDAEQISQLRMDETVQEAMCYEEITSVNLQQAANWKKPLPRGAKLEIAARADRQITVNQGVSLEFPKLVRRLESRLATYNVKWEVETRSYFRSARYYVLILLYMLVVVLSSTVFAEVIFSRGGMPPGFVSMLVSAVVLLLPVQFAPQINRTFRSGTRGRVRVLLIGFLALVFGCYLAWLYPAALIVVALALGFGLLVQIVLWIIRLFE